MPSEKQYIVYIQTFKPTPFRLINYTELYFQCDLSLTVGKLSSTRSFGSVTSQANTSQANTSQAKWMWSDSLTR